jgi:eukaryotic-like serine/threonine-protein kinase
LWFLYDFLAKAPFGADWSLANEDSVSSSNEPSVSPSGEHPPLDTGARLGRYLIIERVGSGAMGVVYGAYDPELDRKIALKLLKGSELGREDAGPARLLREAKAMARLAHPNVIAVHDVGIFDGQVFLAMEFLGGGTLKSWLGARPRNWRAVLDAFVAAGRGLAAAHAAGLVHRDFKPENVLLDRDGRPRVVDFGLAREAAACAQDGTGAVTFAAAAESSGNHLETLTRTGAIMGTPAYMAPEQIVCDATDERTDQFSFCVALYEALYGDRPFHGESLLQLLHNVSEGDLEPVPENREVPTWIRRAVLRGLKADPAQRWPSMAPLIAALEDDPAARHRRRLLAGAALGLVLAGAVVVAQVARHRHQTAEREIGRHLHDGALAAQSGRAKAADLRELRRRSFEAFDAVDRARGDELWHQARALVPTADGAFQRAEQAFETALVLDADRAEARRALVDLLYEHIVLARELHRDEQARALAVLLDRYDDAGVRKAELRRQATLMVRIAPVTAAIRLERYQTDPASGRREALPVSFAPVPGAAVALPPGSYRLLARTPGYADTVQVFELEGGQRREIDLRLPRALAVPTDFVYVPPGEFWFGDADEQLRTQFLGTVPIHRRRTAAYLIARQETSWAEWIGFLEAQPAEARARLAPSLSTALRGSLRLREMDGSWQLSFQPTASRYVAKAGEPILYAGRRTRARQDWLHLPVAGVSPADAGRYMAWLRATGRVPGARLCTEVEWERAARGADDRLFPHGDELRAEDANFDLTYGRKDPAYGPDEVGTHPASRSPFGVDDMAGNVFELMTSSLGANEVVVRGGGYYFAAINCRVTNRQVVPSGFRDMTTGIRVCASVEGETDEAPR